MTKGKMINQFLRAFQKLKSHEDHYSLVAGPELRRVRFYLTNLYRSFCAYNRGEVPFYFVELNLEAWNEEGKPLLRRVLNDWHFRPPRLIADAIIGDTHDDDYYTTTKKEFFDMRASSSYGKATSGSTFTGGDLGPLSTRVPTIDNRYVQAKKNALAASLIAYLNEGGNIH